MIYFCFELILDVFIQEFYNYNMFDDERSFFIDFVFTDDVVESLGRGNIEIWMPFVDAKFNSIVKVIKNLDSNMRFKVLGATAIKTRKFILDINKSVRDNYMYGEDAILKALVKVFMGA